MKHALGLVILLAACGGKSTSKTSSTATCADAGERTATEAVAGLPTGAPIGDFGARYAAVITQLCTDDRWSGKLIACVAASEQDCTPLLDDTQREHLVAETDRIVDEMIASLGGGDKPDDPVPDSGKLAEDLHEPTGIEACDAMRNDVSLLVGCTAAEDGMGASLDELVAGARAVTTLEPAEAQAWCEQRADYAMNLTYEYQCVGG